MITDFSGNQGTDFRYVPKEGFGWTNGVCTSPKTFIDIIAKYQLLSRLVSKP